MKPSSAATASNSRPAEVVVKTRVPLANRRRDSSQREGKSNGAGGQIRQVVDLRQEARRGLHRMPGRRVAAGQGGRPQMPHPLDPFRDAAGEQLAAPDRAVVAETGAVQG